MPVSRRRLLRAGLALTAAAALGGCGFRLRGPQPMDFATLHVNVSAQTELGAQLRRLVAVSGSTVVVEEEAAAEARLQILGNARSREILSLTGAGKVREYQLHQNLQFQLLDKAGAYAIQDAAFSPVASRNGCYCNVVGLPLWTVRRLLERAGIRKAGAVMPDVCRACPLRPAQ